MSSLIGGDANADEEPVKLHGSSYRARLGLVTSDRSWPSSTNIIAATDVTGFVIEAAQYALPVKT